MAPIADGTPFQFGIYTFYFGRGIVELEDASTLSEQPEALRHQLERGGHLFIRNCHPQNTVETARDFTLEAIRQRGSLAPNTPLEQGIAAEPYKNFSFFRQFDVAHAPKILQVVDSTQTFDFYQRLLGGNDVITFEKPWLRCIAQGNHDPLPLRSGLRGTRNTRRYTM